VSEVQWGWNLNVRGGKVRKRRKAASCVVIDVSVSGALVAAQTTADIRVGSTLWIEAHGELNEVRVVRMQALEPGKTMYGITFFAVQPQLALYLARTTGGHRRELTSLWQTAR
jgi:hypothetical protein